MRLWSFVFLMFAGFGVSLLWGESQEASPKAVSFEGASVAIPEKVNPPPSSLKKKSKSKSVYHIPASSADSASHSDKTPSSVMKIDSAAISPTLPKNLREVSGLYLNKAYRVEVLAEASQEMDDGFIFSSNPGALALKSGASRDERVLLVAHANALELPSSAACSPKDIAQGRLLSDFVYQREPFAYGAASRFTYDIRSQKLLRKELAGAGLDSPAGVCALPWGGFLVAEGRSTPAMGAKAPAHGYVFELSAPRGLTPLTPLKPMGRFEHAGLAADSASQVIYMAQAREECFGLFYRFKPSAWGQLAQGGALEALAIIGEPKADTRNAESDLMKLGRAYEVYWIPAASASPEDRESKISTELYYTATPAIFAPLSSVIHSQGRTLFVCATGGARGKGQLFELKGKRLALLEEFGDESGPVYPTSLALGRDGEIYIGERRDDGKPCRLFIKRPKGGYEVLLQTKPIDTPEAIGGLALEEGILFATLSGSGRLVALIPQK